MELMVALGLFSLIMLALYRYYQWQQYDFHYQQRYWQAWQFADQQLERLVNGLPLTNNVIWAGQWSYHWQQLTTQCQQVTVQVEWWTNRQITAQRWRCQAPHFRQQ